MRRLLVLFTALISSVCAMAQLPKDKLDRLMEGYATSNSFNGVVLVAKKGAVLLEKGYGYSDGQMQIRNSQASMFRIGQVTEIITAEAILQLDSKGKLGLDEKIIKYLPDFPNGHKISIKNLLTHTSGIYDYSHDSMLMGMYGSKPIKKQTILSAFKNAPLAFEPGTMYAYSASNYFLLGCIVEQITKWGFQNQVGDKLFAACGMHHSGFDYLNLRDANKAAGYTDATFGPALPVDSSALFGWGDVYSTAGDLYKFHQALHWNKLLPKDWQDLAYSPVKGQYALGWKVEQIYNKRFTEHEGSISGFTSFVIRQEQDDLCIVLLQNVGHPSVPLSTIAGNILKALYGPEPKKTPEKTHEKNTDKTSDKIADHTQDKSADKKEPIKKNVETLKKYVGEFGFSPTLFLTFSLKETDLYVEGQNHALMAMTEEKPGVFSIVGSTAKIEFVKDKKGKVNKAILHQNGQDVTGERLP